MHQQQCSAFLPLSGFSMISVIITLTFSLQLTPGFAGDSGVTQIPRLLWAEKGNPAEMKCSHDKEPSYSLMYWFRQVPGKSMELIVFISSSKKELDENKFSATKESAQVGSLTVRKVELNDSALYFCAYDQCCHHPSFLTSVDSRFRRRQWGHSEPWSTLGSADMNCSQKKGPTYRHMYWFRQLPGKPMEHIVYITPTSEPDLGTFSKEKFSATKKSPGTGSFTVKNVEIHQQQCSALLPLSGFSMISVIITLTFSLQLTPGFAGDSGVTQIPRLLWAEKGNPAEINCSHDKGDTYSLMYWFRQVPGKPMELIVFISSSRKELDENKFSATKESAQVGSLTVRKVELNDSALYFCASIYTPYSVVGSMISVVTILAFSLQWTPGFAEDSGVTQSPGVLWVEKGNSADMNCSQKKGPTYRYMHWFRQLPGKPMEHIVYITPSREPNFGTFSKEKFSATKKSPGTGSFTVKNVESEDSALYFCAVSEHCVTVLLHC
ncbi:hypothetical protein NFI96_000503 [Prochilodus magdalenae]|nr:hypothetical protein NFI96_000503 [Prochilodus magdalenae]